MLLYAQADRTTAEIDSPGMPSTAGSCQYGQAQAMIWAVAQCMPLRDTDLIYRMARRTREAEYCRWLPLEASTGPGAELPRGAAESWSRTLAMSRAMACDMLDASAPRSRGLMERSVEMVGEVPYRGDTLECSVPAACKFG